VLLLSGEKDELIPQRHMVGLREEFDRVTRKALGLVDPPEEKVKSEWVDQKDGREARDLEKEKEEQERRLRDRKRSEIENERATWVSIPGGGHSAYLLSFIIPQSLSLFQLHWNSPFSLTFFLILCADEIGRR
jgi:hypothetical protein